MVPSTSLPYQLIDTGRGYVCSILFHGSAKDAGRGRFDCIFSPGLLYPETGPPRSGPVPSCSGPGLFYSGLIIKISFLRIMTTLARKALFIQDGGLVIIFSDRQARSSFKMSAISGSFIFLLEDDVLCLNVYSQVCEDDANKLVSSFPIVCYVTLFC